MTTQFPPAPTYESPVQENPRTGEFSFSPNWLSWFLLIQQFVTSAGGGGSGVAHNSTTGLQGGTSNQYYHLTAAQYGLFAGADLLRFDFVAGTATRAPATLAPGTNLTTPAAGSLEYSGTRFYLTPADATRRRINVSDDVTLPAAITVGASPFTHQNTTNYDSDVIVQGGIVTKIEFTRDNATFYDLGVLAGMFRLSPGDRLKVTHGGAPTMTGVPR